MHTVNQDLFSYLPYPVDVLHEWKCREDFILFCKHNNVSPVVRIILSSDGSLVNSLNALQMTEIQVRVVKQQEILIDTPIIEYMGSEDNNPVTGIERQAWLYGDRERIVFAYSFIEIPVIEDRVLAHIWKRDMPVGNLLSENHMPVMKDRFVISKVKSPFLSREFGDCSDTLWARYYRLSGGPRFKAAIFEVFSPRIFHP